ncbi:MAG TPA: hypothetical protein P5295_03420 [Spirochaetota bacterium]|nr:hypothetical protein [Spirochaetota bacterium]
MKKIVIFLGFCIILFVAFVYLNRTNETIVYYYNKFRNVHDIRERLLSELRPVTLDNCTLKRYGAPDDGGYLMCANLMSDSKSAYSYGIDGRDEWGCDVATFRSIPLHQYDCFNLTRTVCKNAELHFNEECIGGTDEIIEGRIFNTLTTQINKNNDQNKQLVVKMDIEGAEWDSILATSNEILNNISQFVIEFHWANSEKHIRTIRKLKETFYIAHVHFNNNGCTRHAYPMPSEVYEVLFVNKKIGVIDPNAPTPKFPNSLDSPNNKNLPDCQYNWE